MSLSLSAAERRDLDLLKSTAEGLSKLNHADPENCYKQCRVTVLQVDSLKQDEFARKLKVFVDKLPAPQGSTDVVNKMVIYDGKQESPSGFQSAINLAISEQKILFLITRFEDLCPDLGDDAKGCAKAAARVDVVRSEVQSVRNRNSALMLVALVHDPCQMHSAVRGSGVRGNENFCCKF